MDASAPTGRTAYGKACLNCSRAKYKCLYRSDGNGCERCFRLRRACIPSRSARRVESHDRSHGQNAIANTPEQPPALPPLKGVANFGLVATHGALGSTVLTPPLTVDEQLCYTPTSEGAAKEQLVLFRQTFLPSFPVIHLSADVSVESMRRERPFLWLVISSLTTKFAAHQAVMAEQIGQIVSQKIVAGHEKSLDLLQGLLCYLGWYHHYKKDSNYIASWAHMAVALLNDLGLHKAPREPPAASGQLSSKYFGWPPPGPSPHQRTLDERRALIGMYCISSMIWLSMRQMEPLRWTPYMEECAHVLRSEAQSDLDELLVMQARYRLVMDQVTDAASEDWTEITSTSSSSDKPAGPSPFFIKAILSKAADIRASLPPSLQTHIEARLYAHSTEITAREVLLRSSRAFSSPTPPSPDLHRLENLDALLTAITSWYAVRNSGPVADTIGTSFAIAAQWSHGIILLFKLTTLDEPGWDCNQVAQRADLLALMETNAQRMEEVITIHQLVDNLAGEESGMFFKAPKMVRAVKATFAAELCAWKDKQTDAALPENLDSLSRDSCDALTADYGMCLAEDPLFPDLFLGSWDL